MAHIMILFQLPKKKYMLCQNRTQQRNIARKVAQYCSEFNFLLGNPREWNMLQECSSAIQKH